MQVRVIGDNLYGRDWVRLRSGGGSRGTGHSIATIKEQRGGIQGLLVIPLEEIKNAKVVVEQDKERVRFVLQHKEIIYDKSGFRVE